MISVANALAGSEIAVTGPAPRQIPVLAKIREPRKVLGTRRAGTDGFIWGRWLSLSSSEQEAWFQIFLAQERRRFIEPLARASARGDGRASSTAKV